MANRYQLEKIVEHFEAWSNPKSANSLEPATVADVRRVVDNTAEMMRAFIEELYRKD